MRSYGQALVLQVQLTVAGKRYTRKITLNPQAPDRPTLLDAPKLVAKDDAGLSIINAISDPDGVRDVRYILYIDVAGKSETARNSSGVFTGLSANTAYYAVTTAETLDRATRKWTAQASPLLPVTTDQAMPTAFSFNAVSGVSLNAQLTSNAITVSGLHGAAAVSVMGGEGEYALDGGAWTNTAGTVNNGQTVQVRGTAASGYSTVGKVTLTIGGRSADFTMTTFAAPVVIYYPPTIYPTNDVATTFSLAAIPSASFTVNHNPGGTPQIYTTEVVTIDKSQLPQGVDTGVSQVYRIKDSTNEIIISNTAYSNTGNITFASGTLPAGSYTFEIVATGTNTAANGGSSAATQATLSSTFDIVPPPAPNAPSVTADNASDTITGLDGTMKYRISIDGGTNFGSNAPNYDDGFYTDGSIAPTVSGTKKVEVIVKAVGAFPESAATTLDFTSATITGPANNAQMNTDQSFTFDGGTATLSKDGAPATSYLSGTSITLEGVYVWTHSDGTVRNLTIDKTAPALSGAPANNAFVNTDQTITFTGTGSLVKDGGAPTVFASGGTISAEGDYTLTVTDGAGNITVRDFIVDKTPPAIVTPPPAGILDGSTINFTAGDPALEGSFTVSGVKTITTTDGLEVSIDGTNFFASITTGLDPTSAIPVTVYFKYNPVTPGAYPTSIELNDGVGTGNITTLTASIDVAAPAP